MNIKNTDPKLCFATNLKRYMEVFKVSRKNYQMILILNTLQYVNG